MSNPYNATFGKIPEEHISRLSICEQILQEFCSEIPENNARMILGVRGSGKTVTLNEVCNKFKALDDWVVIKLNSNRDLLGPLLAKMYSNEKLYSFLENLEIDLSFFGIKTKLKSGAPVSDIEVALERVLEYVNKKGKRVLIAIDEADSSSEMKIFTTFFQTAVGEDLPVFLLMTGLYENIYSLQNSKKNTFLLRTPKSEMYPLDAGVMAESYKRNLNISLDEAKKMARLTKGYSFAFQALGYICVDKKSHYKDILHIFDQYLNEFVYTKIWLELSEIDKKVATAIKDSKGDIKSIMAACDMEKNKFSVYRDRLKKKGIIICSSYGKIDFALPRFEVFIDNCIW